VPVPVPVLVLGTIHRPRGRVSSILMALNP